MKFRSGLIFLLCSQLMPLFGGELADRIDAVVHNYADQHRFSGTVLVARGDEVLYKQGHGLANHTYDVPNKPETPFIVGSVSKQFASMLILQLVEEGKISLSDPLGKWFPDFPAEKAEKITIHHLLSHSSGLPHYAGLIELGLNQAEYDRVYRPLDEYAATIGKTRLKWAPGTRMSYSSQGYILLGLIAEKTTGKSLNQLIQEKISKPLGLKNTGFALNETVIKGLASSYQYEFHKSEDGELSMTHRNAAYRDQTNTFCTGGVHSTVEDLFLWMRALMTDKLLGKALRDKMFSVQSEPYGYGWFITNPATWGLDKGTHIINHGGATQSYRAQVAILDHGKYTIAILGNTNASRSTPLAQSIAQVLYGKQPAPGNIMGTAVAWKMVSQGEEAATAFFKKKKAENFSGFLDNDYAYRVYVGRFLHNGKPAMARSLANLGRQAHPKSALLLVGLANIASHEGNHEQAAVHLREALAMADANPAGNEGVKEEATRLLAGLK